MRDLIIFNVGSNHYALNIDYVQRIIQAIGLTDIPNSNRCIDGMMSYEHRVIKVLNFRKLIGLKAHEEDALNPDEYAQKFIIVDRDGICFAVKVDSIEDIAHIEDSSIMDSDNDATNNEFLELDGVLDIDGVLINVIKTLNLPS